MTNPLVELDLQTLSHVTGGTVVEITINGQRVHPQAAAASGVHVSVDSSGDGGPRVGGPSMARPSGLGAGGQNVASAYGQGLGGPSPRPYGPSPGAYA